jgi:signal transduction histidine kinase
VSSAATVHRLVVRRPSSGALVDVAIAAAALVGSIAQLAHQGSGPLQSGPQELDWLGGVLTACATLPLVAWRRDPRAVFALTAAASVALAGLGYVMSFPLGPTAALYLFAASRGESEPWTRRDGAAVVALFAAYLVASGLGVGGLPGSQLLHTGLAWAVAWFAGERTRLRNERIAELEERALRAEREAERDRRLAAAEERARIARDLHDSVGHAINVIVVRAGAARLRHEQDPDRSLSALATIEDVARQTVADIDQIVAALRDGTSAPGPPAAPLTLASLAVLVEHHSAGGLAVTVRTDGSPRPLAHATDQAAYRILQEALTNSARHGTGTAEVEVSFTATALELTVTNPVRERGTERTGGGHGVLGMRERATLLGGSLDARRVDGRFRLHAQLPYRDRPR